MVDATRDGGPAHFPAARGQSNLWRQSSREATRELGNPVSDSGSIFRSLSTHCTKLSMASNIHLFMWSLGDKQPSAKFFAALAPASSFSADWISMCFGCAYYPQIAMEKIRPEQQSRTSIKPPQAGVLRLFVSRVSQQTSSAVIPVADTCLMGFRLKTGCCFIEQTRRVPKRIPMCVSNKNMGPPAVISRNKTMPLCRSPCLPFSDRAGHDTQTYFVE